MPQLEIKIQSVVQEEIFFQAVLHLIVWTICIFCWMPVWLVACLAPCQGINSYCKECRKCGDIVITQGTLLWDTCYKYIEGHLEISQLINIKLKIYGCEEL